MRRKTSKQKQDRAQSLEQVRPLLPFPDPLLRKRGKKRTKSFAQRLALWLTILRKRKDVLGPLPALSQPLVASVQKKKKKKKGKRERERPIQPAAVRRAARRERPFREGGRKKKKKTPWTNRITSLSQQKKNIKHKGRGEKRKKKEENKRV